RPALDGFTYSTTEHRYRYIWQAEPEFANTCELFTLKLRDGSVHQLRFHFAPFRWLAPIQRWATPNSAIPGQKLAMSFRAGPPVVPASELVVDGFPQSRQINCSDTNRVGDLDATDPPGVGSVTRNGLVYSYTWQTERAWSGTCRRFRILLQDGTSELA